MNPFKTLALTLSMLALLAVNAMAQCGGKVVNIQLPEGWGGSTYIIWEGQFRQITGVKDGNFTRFTLPTGLPNDGPNKTEIIFTDINSHYNGSGISYINTNAIGKSPNLPDGNKFTCSSFKDVTYIYPDPGNSAKTIISENPPDTKYFYFLPPDDPEWIRSMPHLAIEGQTPTPMKPMDNMCGWYSLTFSPTGAGGLPPLPTGDAYIWAGATKPDTDDKILGALGMASEDITQKEAIVLANRFGENRQMYFVSDYGTWAPIDPMINERHRCSYSFAAMIYYKGHNFNGRSEGFSFYGEGGTGEGLCRGYVKSDLVQAPNDASQTIKKMQFDRNACNGDWTKEYFDKAFNNNNLSDPPLRKICYDMPFEKRPDGNWEFDAYYMDRSGLFLDYTGRNTTGGFYLPPNLLGGIIGTTYKGDRIGVKPAHQFCFDRGRQSRSDNGDNATNISQCGPIWQNGMVASSVAAHDDQGNNGYGKIEGITGLLCFESAPAKIKYEKGQQFFFRGDDDIWVFINNKLALDLGGNHMPIGGYINMDELGLEVGKEYPINIFFCDRRGTGSNVRISTNMYFDQQMGIIPPSNIKGGGEMCIKESGGGSCGGGGSKETCGQEIAKCLSYYMILASDPDGKEIPLNGENCTQNGDILQCLGAGETGISINTKTGYVKINPTISGYTGRFRVFAKINETQCPNYANVDDKYIGATSGSSKMSVVWGNLVDDLGKVIPGVPAKIPYTCLDGSKCEKEGMRAVASQLVMVGFASGEKQSEGRFSIDTESGIGQKVQLSSLGIIDNDVGGNLRVFTDSLGLNEVSVTSAFTIPETGVLLLWFTGNFEASGTATYNISTGKGESFALEVHQPKIEFVYSDRKIIPEADRIGSDPSKGPDVKTRNVVYASTALSRKIAAYIPKSVDGDGTKICATCKFNNIDMKTKTYWKVKDGFDEANINAITYSSNKIDEGGYGEMLFAGTSPVVGDTFVYFSIGGPSSEKTTLSTWDSLQFHEPPVPYPDSVAIFDRTGDGKGDSIMIVYNKKFPLCENVNEPGPSPTCEPGKGMLDSLPNFLEILWDLDSTEILGFGHKDVKDRGKNTEGKYDNSPLYAMENGKIIEEDMCSLTKGREDEFPQYWKKDADGKALKIPYECELSSDQKVKRTDAAKNWSFWKDFVKTETCAADGFRTNGSKCQDSIIITLPTASVVDTAFSKAVKTARYGEERVFSWSTFLGLEGGKEMSDKFEERIEDKISPIITLAEYEDGTATDSKCGNRNRKCNDKIFLEFSEPIKLLPELLENAVKEAFAYKLKSTKGEATEYDIYNDAESEMKNWRFQVGNGKMPSPNGDSIVTITYQAFNSDNDISSTPVPRDWVRFLKRDGDPLAHAFIDMVGNAPNPNEIGKEIVGKRRFNQDKNLIANLDADKAEENFGNKVKDRFKEDPAVDDILKLHDPKTPNVGMLPVPDTWAGSGLKDSLPLWYPGTVGTVFWPEVKNVVANLEQKHNIKIKPEEIVFTANSFHHTNIGGYVTKSGSIKVKCSDPIFQIDGKGDCLSQNGIYLAWNLKDDKNRWVGTGAYVQVYNFRWEITNKAVPANERVHDKYPKDGNKTELFGVRRVKSGKK